MTNPITKIMSSSSSSTAATAAPQSPSRNKRTKISRCQAPSQHPRPHGDAAVPLWHYLKSRKSVRGRSALAAWGPGVLRAARGGVRVKNPCSILESRRGSPITRPHNRRESGTHNQQCGRRACCGCPSLELHLLLPMSN